MTDVRGSDQRNPPRSSLARRVRRRRTIALALSVVLGTALVLWGGDWLARLGAQSVLASTVQDYAGSPEQPTVRIRGTVFLPQVIRGRYDHIEVDMESVSNGPLRLQSLQADLFGVHLPFHDVLVGKSNQVFIDRTTEESLLTWGDLNRYLTFTGRSIQLEPTESGEVRLSATVELLGATVSATAEAQLLAEGGAIPVRPLPLRTDTPLDSASELLLGQRFRS